MLVDAKRIYDAFVEKSFLVLFQFGSLWLHTVKHPFAQLSHSVAGYARQGFGGYLDADTLFTVSKQHEVIALICIEILIRDKILFTYCL